MGNFEISGSNDLFRHEKLLPGADILYSRTIYSLEINSRTEKILVPTCDLQIGPIVLGEDLGIS